MDALQNPWMLALVAGVFGLAIGSFLNVIIYRLPIMMQRDWRAQCLDFLDMPADKTSETKFNLMLPRSHCPACKKTIPWWRNIPLLSYILLAGRCAECQAKISPRYFMIELFTGILSGFIAYQFGPSYPMLAVLLLSWGLIVLVFVDIDHQLLPDDIVLSLLWLGLLCNAFGWFVTPAAAILGAVLGYGVLWIFANVFMWLRGKEGMGYGDFKLFALFGAWLGWQALLPIILIASLLGVIGGFLFLLLRKSPKDTPLPFGPYLAFAGLLMLFWGQSVMAFFISFIN